MSDPIKVKKEGPILEVTIDRPKANAIDSKTSIILGDIFADFRDNPDLRVAILTGAGEKFFSAGWDLKAASKGEAADADYGVGEIVVNSIDKDGTMAGYDVNLVERIRDIVDVPLTILGGAGSFDDIHQLIDRFEIIGAAAGSLFVFKGKYRAVLINYPSIEEKQAACSRRIGVKAAA